MTPVSPATPRILVVSMRGHRFQAANTIQYEFEDFLCRHLGATLCAPVAEPSMSRRRWRLARYLGASDVTASRFARVPAAHASADRYDLTIVVADNPYQLHALAQVDGWQHRTGTRVGYITELWPPMLASWRMRREPLSLYDAFLIGSGGGHDELARVSGRPTGFIPLAVDTDRFVPSDPAAERPIDAIYVGRRLPVVHAGAMGWATRHDRLYFHDTARSQPLQVDDPAAHRRLYASLLKRARYSFAFPAKLDKRQETGGVSEIGARYYELSAAGVTILGRRPDVAHFDTLFGHTDAVIDFDPDRDDPGSVLDALEREPARRTAIAVHGAANALRQHDWSHRIAAMFAFIGTPVPEAVEARIAALAHRADALSPPA